MRIGSIQELEAIYGPVGVTSTAKVACCLTPHYRAFIEASPFVTLATSGPEGLDCSPRGDIPGSLVRIVNDGTLLMPDRRGNNRIDSLRNIVRDSRVALLFLIPGCGNTIRLNGNAVVLADPALLRSFVVDGKAPRTVIEITIAEVYFQCARAIMRSNLWNPSIHADPRSLPTPGQILAAMSDNIVDGKDYDDNWLGRAKTSMW